MVNAQRAEIRHHVLRVVAAAVPALATLGGCSGSMNAEPGLLGAPPLPALSPDQSAGRRADDGPSLQGLDRRNWPVQTVLVPDGQVETNPTYVDTIVEDRSLPRQRGEYPTLRSMLDESGSTGDQWLAALAEYPLAAGQLLAWPVRMVFVTPPNAVVRDSREPFQRMPEPSTSVAPAVNDPWVWVTPQPGATPLPVAPVLPDDGDGDGGAAATNGAGQP